MIVALLAVLLQTSAPADTSAAGAAARLRAALDAPDPAAVASLVHVADDRAGPLLESYVELLVATRKLQKASDAAFAPPAIPGQEPIPLSPPPPVVDQATADTARVRLAPDAEPLPFVLADGSWKLDLAAIVADDPQRLPEQIRLLRGLAKIMTQTADELAAGRYVTAADAQATLSQRVAEWIGRQSLPPATQPARP
jgi:hypothetical protein